jgi:hypothetical protein
MSVVFCVWIWVGQCCGLLSIVKIWACCLQRCYGGVYSEVVFCIWLLMLWLRTTHNALRPLLRRPGNAHTHGMQHQCIVA